MCLLSRALKIKWQWAFLHTQNPLVIKVPFNKLQKMKNDSRWNSNSLVLQTLSWHCMHKPLFALFQRCILLLFLCVLSLRGHLKEILAWFFFWEPGVWLRWCFMCLHLQILKIQSGPSSPELLDLLKVS